ncbi:hypothetical protein IKW75_01345, partial [Candidatus Saccharibacteria bacterium]|nr:hypothetical protein [Candidatus Saccharibacteria bacterium]
MKKLSFLLLLAVILFSLAGCGKDASATSGSSADAANEVAAAKPADSAEVVKTEPNEENTEQLNNETSKDETEIQESEEIVPEPKETTFVNWEDYLDGNTWNLTAYAEALGYTWIPDPEYEGLVMYMVEHNGSKYYFTY